jgi:4-alpha-glucanotransferase
MSGSSSGSGSRPDMSGSSSGSGSRPDMSGSSSGSGSRSGTDLLELARAHGVQPAYRDVDDREQVADPDALIAVLRALDVRIERPDDAERLLREHRARHWHRAVEPVVAAFDRDVGVEVRLPESDAVGPVACRLTHESGELHTWTADLASLPRVGGAEVDGRGYVALRLDVRDLPHGYHDLAVEVAGSAHETLLIIAPARAYTPPGAGRAWGGFLPLHALRTARSWGAGDLTDLRELAAWTGGQGASFVGTLPLLPVFLGDAEEPFDPSPYNPVSRLLWNEVVIDPAATPEAEACADASETIRSLAPRIAELREGRYVDHADLAAVKGQALRSLARCLYEDLPQRREELERSLAESPELAAYARFRGAVARLGAAWWDWPSELGTEHVDPETERLHLYAQMVAAEQVGDLAERLREADQQLYLDLPIGTRRDGFDVWHQRDVFAVDADTGAPPDTIFPGGQNWRFPPLHPERLREQGYAYLRAVLRHHMTLADALRIDHVMGLHRLFWIPQGQAASDGVYVSYPADEWYAIVNLESHRHRTWIIGENLGTVPPHVEDALQERGIARMYVVQYEAAPDRYDVLERVAGDEVASVNTHDMPPFASWWLGDDLTLGQELGHLDEHEAAADRAERATIRRHLASLLEAEGRIEDGVDTPREVLEGLLEWLASSAAPLVLVNLEDLWLETEPQNVPGTGDERPNWRRRAALTLEEARARDDVAATLRRVDEARRRDDGGRR